MAGMCSSMPAPTTGLTGQYCSGRTYLLGGCCTLVASSWTNIGILHDSSPISALLECFL
uniref:Uncharacterized protein n=1 Tax=Arundo donax TaxID=35708 RepID=A0A0A8Z3V5_ARUDO